MRHYAILQPCLYCTKPFFPRYAHTQFCSQPCWHKYRHVQASKNIIPRLLARIQQCVHEAMCLYCCWPWTGQRDPNEYGRLTVDRRPLLAHRLMYATWHQCILPPAVHVLHHCDNPPCCNPDHLFAGNQRINMQDAMHKRRHQFGERHSHAKIPTDGIALIHQLLAQGVYQRIIAEQFGVKREAISKIARGITRKLG